MYFHPQICSKCFSYMITHPSESGWWKCPTCGFCKKQEKVNNDIDE